MTTYQEDRVSPYRWVVIGSLTSSVAVALTVMFVIGLLLPEISEELGLSPSQQGWLGSSVIFGNLIFAIPANLWLSRYRPWRIASLAFLGVAFFTLVQAWSPVFAILILGRIGLGISFIASQAPRAMIIMQWTPRRRMPFTQGVVFGSIDIFMGIAFFATPLLVQWLGSWRDALYVMSGVAFLTSGLWLVLGKERDTGEYRERMQAQLQSPLLTILKYKQLWIMGLGMATSMMAQTAFQTFWPTFAQAGLGASATATGVALGLMQVVAGPTDFLANALPALARRQPAVLAVCGLATAGVYFGLLYVDSIPLLYLLSIVRGLFFAFFPVLMLMVYQLPEIKPREVTVGIAFMQTSIWLGASVGPLLVGFLQEATGDLRLGLLVTAFAPLALVVVAVILQAQKVGVARRLAMSMDTGGEA